MYKTVRLKFKKKSLAKYISHLDLNRFMMRLLRYSKLDFWYTEGYSPRPYINFAMALPLGFSSKCEMLDIKVNENQNLNELISKFNEFDKNIEFISVYYPERKFSEITFAKYIISNISNDVIDIYNNNELLIDKKTKKGIKQISVKDYVRSIDFKNDELVVILKTGCKESLNPTYLIDALNNKGAEIKNPKYTRVNFYDEKLNEFK